jgi:very-short-patch-repair endonuclease
VLSNPEQILYFRLCKAFPEYIVLAQVALSRMLGVNKGNNFGQWFNRINRLSADFVLCSKDSTIVAVIELDDSSHTKTTRQIADTKKDKALQSAGIRIMRWKVNSIPDEATIKALFAQIVQNPQSMLSAKLHER